MRTDEITLDTSNSRVTDVTRAVEDFVSASGTDGLLNVFLPHATAGVALMETGSGSEQDLETILGSVLPRKHAYVHSHGSPGHGADHLLPVLISPSLTIPVQAGRLQLGTWQSIVIVDLNRDNPTRRLRLSFLESPDR
jgi:secondary thiamine-phosphate synthase enzyme